MNRVDPDRMPRTIRPARPGDGDDHRAVVSLIRVIENQQRGLLASAARVPAGGVDVSEIQGIGGGAITGTSRLTRIVTLLDWKLC